MEKLKAKHDHKLTDILKVAIFGLMLILPGLILLPSMLYYGVNEYATAPTEQVEIYEYRQVDFNQLSTYRNSGTYYDLTYVNNETYLTINGTANPDAYGQVIIGNDIEFLRDGTKYYISVSGNNGYTFGINGYGAENSQPYIFSATAQDSWYGALTLKIPQNTNVNLDNLQGFVVNLTQMFGAGNEPTAQEFKELYPENYYDYTLSKIETLEIPTGTYKTYTDITSQIQYNWNSLWQQPLFNWTNYTIVKQGIDNFTGVFGITNTSNISNLIAYELIIVAIYIVIDIVLTLFKWLTHLIGEK